MEKGRPQDDWINKTLDASLWVEGGGLAMATILASSPGIAIACLGLALSITAKELYNNE